MKRIAIISGGICGLSAAFTLEERRRTRVPLEYVLYESSSRLGGVISTERVDGCVVEAGPDSFLTEKPWPAALRRLWRRLFSAQHARDSAAFCADGSQSRQPGTCHACRA